VAKLRTIDMDKLEHEIDKRATAADAVRGGRSSLSVERAIQYSSIMAEHNALIAVFNSLK